MSRVGSVEWAKEFCERWHGGKCSFCERRKPRKGSISCGPCQKKNEAAEKEKRAAEEREFEAEMRFEMLAAFGPGEEVVDIITGKRWRT